MMEEDYKSEYSIEDNRSTKSEERKKSFKDNIVKSLSSKELKNTIFSNFYRNKFNLAIY